MFLIYTEGMETDLLSWEAPEYVRNVRTPDWYWGVSLLGIAGVFACVYWGNYLFGVVVLLSVILIIVAAVRPVHTYNVALTAAGILVNGKFVAYEHVSGFWFFNHQREGEKLLLKSDTKWIPTTTIPLTDKVTVDQVRGILTGRVPEVEITIPIVVQIFEELF